MPLRNLTMIEGFEAFLCASQIHKILEHPDNCDNKLGVTKENFKSM